MRSLCAALSTLLLIACMLTVAPQDPASRVDASLQGDLLRAIADPAPAIRLRAIDELDDRPDVATWRRVILGLPPLPLETELSAGRETTLEVPLWNGEGVESTELAVRIPPDHAADRPAPLLLLAHGSGGTGRGQTGLFAAATDALGMVVVAPYESGPNDGYHYSDRERRITLSAIRWCKRHLRIDDDRVFLGGISRGGHLTWDLGTREPTEFAGLIPMIGGPRLNPGGGQNNLRYVENIANLPLRDLQGARDDPRMIFNLGLAFERLIALGAQDAQYLEFPKLGHSFEADAVDWQTFFGAVRRDPLPRRVVRLAAREGEGRAYWLEIAATDSRKVKDDVPLRVDAKRWNALDDEGQRRLAQDLVDAATARAEAEWSAPGEITVKSRLVQELAIHVVPEMLDEDGKLKVRFNGKQRRFTPKPNARTLLREFAVRADRSFLPVDTVEVR